MLLGLTGGIASGKTTFRCLLNEKHDFVVFDADECVHQLLKSDTQLIAEISSVFGDTVVASDGSIDRPALRKIVFSDKAHRARLEQIVHPVVRSRWMALRALCNAEKKNFLADIPLLFETGAENYFDATILVAASGHIQKKRLSKRGIAPEIAQAMLASQSPISEKEKRASVVVWNDGTIGQLEHQACLLIERFFPFP